MSALSRSFSHCRLRRRCNAPAVEVLEYRTLLSAAAIGVTAVEAADSPPQPMLDQYRTRVDRTLTGNVLANDTDPDGDPLIVTAVNGDTTAVGQTVTLPSGAQLTVNADGTFIYEPDNAFPGLAAGEEARDGFSYFVTDEPASGCNWSAQALITVFGAGTEELNRLQQRRLVRGCLGRSFIRDDPVGRVERRRLGPSATWRLQRRWPDRCAGIDRRRLLRWPFNRFWFLHLAVDHVGER